MSITTGLSELHKAAKAAAGRITKTDPRQRATDEAVRRIAPEGKATALVAFIRQTALSSDESVNRDRPSVGDPQTDTFDLAAFRSALAAAGEALAWQVCALLRDSDERVENAVLLVEAAAGWNRASIERSFNHQKLVGIKAYGLLPVAHGGEVIERYMRLQQEAKDAPKLGQQRRISHAAAVRVALANLAQVAGYANASQLEWDMEAKISSDLVSGRRWQSGDYILELVVDGADASIAIERGGKRLKSTPSALRSTEAYQEAKAAVAHLRGQASRMRSGLLEGLIASGEALPPDEVHRLLRLPAARDMFQRLIWRTESGITGLFDAEVFGLRDLADRLHPVTTRIALAHSYHLFADGTLADWQRAIVHAHIVQPIKQAFRELYILTPAELDSVDQSARFAGHRVEAAVAKKLLAVRGWRMDDEDGVLMPYKLRNGVRAAFDFSDTLYVFAASLPAQTGTISFEQWSNGEESQRLPLDAVPPVFFSEVMRDADLVVSVAQRDGETTLSPESYEQRGALVRALLDDLGLPGVEVEGHFAHVQGKLARYRVHLGSAAIHIEPGNYLCIIPDRAAPKRESFYLPFADGDDPKFSEVVSKILLLLADDRVTDETILRQIRRTVG